MEYVGWFVIGFLALRFLVAFLNWISRPYLPKNQAEDLALVSILIPARNEAENLPNLIRTLCLSNYKNVEVLVYDDASIDNTAEVAKSFSDQIPVRVITGMPLPKGWLGKSHACYRLALEAKGDYLLYLDADVTIEPTLVARLVAYTRKRNLALLTIFPFQVMVTRGEKIVVPVMNWILLTLLPLVLVRLSRKVSLSAANGQLMFFDASIYRKNQWHSAVKDVRVEDIAIARLIKRKRLKMATLLGSGEVRCRMYSGYQEAIAGLSRSLPAFFGNSLLFTFVFTFLTTFGFLIIFLSLPWIYGFVYLLAAIFTRLFVLMASKQFSLFNVLTMLHQHYAFIRIVKQSIDAKIKGKTEWKGRDISA